MRKGIFGIYDASSKAPEQQAKLYSSVRASAKQQHIFMILKADNGGSDQTVWMRRPFRSLAILLPFSPWRASFILHTVVVLVFMTGKLKTIHF